MAAFREAMRSVFDSDSKHWVVMSSSALGNEIKIALTKMQHSRLHTNEAAEIAHGTSK